MQKREEQKRLEVYHKCAQWTCKRKYRSLGKVSKNREDKINFIKDGLSKKSLDDVLLTLEMHSNGDMHRHILCYGPNFKRNINVIV